MNNHLLSNRWLIPSGILFYSATLVGILLLTSVITTETVNIEVSVPNLFNIEDPLLGYNQSCHKKDFAR